MAIEVLTIPQNEIRFRLRWNRFHLDVWHLDRRPFMALYGDMI